MLALAICPACPRTSCTRASNGASEPFAASIDIAPTTVAEANKRSAKNKPCKVKAVDTCVPLISAKPSLACNTTGVMPALRKAVCASTNSPLTNTCPSPINASVMCDKGARSPDAPTEPLAGMFGVIPALKIAIMVSITSARMPEKPRAKLAIFISIIKRTTCADNGSPVPTECDRMRLRCNCASCSVAMRFLAKSPKPVLMPYAGKSRATMASTARAEA